MISYYQTRLLPFLSLKSWTLPQNISSNYYLSWEDGLWDVLPSLGILPGSTILLPDFYCPDVINNIQQHGYKVTSYPLDSDFQISKAQFLKIYRQTKPVLVIFFHVSGITNLLSLDQSLIQLLSQKSYVLCDCVHRIVSTHDLSLLSNRYFILDSLRKNTPLSGSCLYCTKDFYNQLATPRIKNTSYTIRVTLLYWLYRLIHLTGVAIKSKSLVKYANARPLKTHDDLVGDSLPGNGGMPWTPLLHRHLDLEKIKSHKSTQAKYYLKYLSSLPIPRIKDRDLGELHAFPLVIKNPLAVKIKAKLEPLNVWPKFEDCPWSRNQKVFFLPLGFHITVSDQDQIIQTILQTIQSQ